MWGQAFSVGSCSKVTRLPVAGCIPHASWSVRTAFRFVSLGPSMDFGSNTYWGRGGSNWVLEHCFVSKKVTHVPLVFSHPLLPYLQVYLFPSCIPTMILWEFLVRFHACYMSPYHPNHNGEEHKSWSFFDSSLFCLSLTLSGPDIRLSAIFYTLCFRNVRDQVSHPCKTVLAVLHILMMAIMAIRL
jgi:hypothetical protein